MTAEVSLLLRSLFTHGSIFIHLHALSLLSRPLLLFFSACFWGVRRGEGCTKAVCRRDAGNHLCWGHQEPDVWVVVGVWVWLCERESEWCNCCNLDTDTRLQRGHREKKTCLPQLFMCGRCKNGITSSSENMEKWRMWAEAKTQNAKVPVHTEAPPQYLIIIIVEFLLKHKASLQVPLTQF